ncbi:putative oligomerization/nucleic acid binding protein [Streptomyces sp. 1114.5]|uniref:SHOCT domain-containing protein n=1 Tax=Streptomyces sp. 1114.5 TaxID=1938830 RepID=UPI000EB59B6E|nr:SHOCT domain-containing protein [Streptomyces sp. 1114.5]RKT19494.1 putative oligomerization/nucleic acid binding protein [Streptomyces sp. 1114.5]
MPGLLRGIARTAVVAGTATAVSNRVSRRQAGRWAQQDMEAEAAPPPPPPPPAPAPAPAAPAAPSMEDRIAQLQQLAQLKDQGVLTEEEFATQKQRLLAG